MGERRRAVITGLGAVTPIGLGVSLFWSAALAGKNGVSTITNFDTQGHAVTIAGEIKDFDPGDWMDPKEAKRVDRFTQFSIAASEEAVRDSGVDFGSIDPYRVGVIIGTGIGGIVEMEAQVTRLNKGGPSRVSPFLIPKLMPNAAAGNVAIRYGVHGPNMDITTACASASHAIGEAVLTIRSGRADIVITGGTEAALTSVGVAGFANMKALTSTHNDDPENASRPFDKDRDGFVMGEGAGGLILEEYEHARKRGARIYAEVAGYSATCDAHHITAPDPGGEVAAKTMQLALDDAHLTRDHVSYINTHSPATRYGDAMECAAIKRLFGERASQPPVSGLKSMVGHLLGASGAVAAIATALSIQEGKVHPTVNYCTPDPDCDVDCVPNEAREMNVSVALSNAFGFGGHNASLVITEVE
ncbi:MAG: beta-ketoacyl-ACP synthase II [Planctomycetota bacterium]